MSRGRSEAEAFEKGPGADLRLGFFAGSVVTNARPCGHGNRGPNVVHKAVTRPKSCGILCEILKCLQRAKGIEPSCEAWEASVLPLNYARLARERVAKVL